MTMKMICSKKKKQKRNVNHWRELRAIQLMAGMKRVGEMWNGTEQEPITAVKKPRK